SSAQVIEADVGNDAVRPGIKTALESETRQVFINFQEGFLIDIAGVFGLMQNIKGNSQDVAIVTLHQLFKRLSVATLGAFNQGALFGWGEISPGDTDGGGTSSRISGRVARPGDCHFLGSHRIALI